MTNTECCGTCKFNKPVREDGKLQGFECACGESDYWCCFTDYNDYCDEYEPKDNLRD